MGLSRALDPDHRCKILSGLLLRQFRKSAAGYIAQTVQSNISLLCALQKFLRNALSSFMVTAMRQLSANLFEYNVHVCGRAFVNLGHSTSPHCH